MHGCELCLNICGVLSHAGEIVYCISCRSMLKLRVKDGICAVGDNSLQLVYDLGGNVVIDFHSHVLPHVDDGSSSMTETEQLLSEQIKDRKSTRLNSSH